MPPDTGSRRRAVTTVLAVAGIALGAGLVVASLAVGRGVDRSIERTVDATLGRADFRISAIGGATLSDDMLVTIRSVLGVEVAAPAVEQQASLVPEVGTVGPPAAPVMVLGIDPILDGQVHDLDLVAGSPLTRQDEAAAIITEQLAADDGYGLGSDVILATLGEPERFRVIGIAAGEGLAAGSEGRSVILPIDVTARMLGLDGVARVDLLVAEGIPLAGVEAELGEALASVPYVLTSPAGLTESLRSSTTGIAGAVSAIAMVGLLVGALFVLLAVWLTDAGLRESDLDRGVRGSATLGAVGFVVGAVLLTALAGVTTPDVAPAAVGLGGVAVAGAVVLAVAVAAGLMPSGRPAAAEPAPIALTGAVGTIGLGLVVAVTLVGANVRGAGVDESVMPVIARLLALLDALALLALVVAAVGIAGSVALWARRRGVRGVQPG
jgi:MacB-like protein